MYGNLLFTFICKENVSTKTFSLHIFVQNYHKYKHKSMNKIKFRLIISSGKFILLPAIAENFTPEKRINRAEKNPHLLGLLTIDEKKLC